MRATLVGRVASPVQGPLGARVAMAQRRQGFSRRQRTGRKAIADVSGWHEWTGNTEGDLVRLWR